MDYLSYIVKVETEKILIGMQQPGIHGEKNIPTCCTFISKTTRHAGFLSFYSTKLCKR